MKEDSPNPNGRVVVIAHGAGCTHAYFLFAYVVDSTWKDTYVQHLVLLGNVIAGGLPSTPAITFLSQPFPDGILMPGAQLQMMLIGASDYAVWTLPDATLWEAYGDLWIWAFAPGPVISWDATELNDFGDFLGISQYWEYAIANDRYPYPGWASSHPGVNTTIICGNGLSTGPITTEFHTNVGPVAGFMNVTFTDAGDDTVPLTTCLQITNWTSADYITEKYVVPFVHHEDLCCNEASRALWLQHLVPDTPEMELFAEGSGGLWV